MSIDFEKLDAAKRKEEYWKLQAIMQSKQLPM